MLGSLLIGINKLEVDQFNTVSTLEVFHSRKILGKLLEMIRKFHSKRSEEETVSEELYHHVGGRNLMLQETYFGP